jgi:6-phosphogluconolactonase/glucosamine-6-phosphate isomerase/deaminase
VTEVVIGDFPAVERALVTTFQDAAADALDARGAFVVALAGGSIAPLFFPSLARLALDWSRVDFFWADERAVPPGHADSNFAEASRLWLQPAGVPADRIHRIHGEDPRSAAGIPGIRRRTAACGRNASGAGLRAARRGVRRPRGVALSRAPATSSGGA